MLGRLRQEDPKFKASLGYSEFKASLGNLVKPCTKMKVKRELGIQKVKREVIQNTCLLCMRP